MERVKNVNGDLMKYSMSRLDAAKNWELTLFRYDEIANGKADNAHREFWHEIEGLREKFADAQATIDQLQREKKILQIEVQAVTDNMNRECRDKDQANATIAALQADNRTYINERHEHAKQIEQLQARVRELEARQDFGACAKCLTNAWRICKEGTPDAVEMKCSNGSTWWLCDYCLSNDQLTQRTEERDTARRRVDELEAREVDVVMLRDDLEQRTAELEAANEKVQFLEKKNSNLLASSNTVLKVKADQDVRLADLQAELERVRGELAEMRERKDGAYLERNRVVAALASCFPSGISRTAIEGWHDDWHGCVYIDLPTGQVSWHYHDSHAHLFAHLPPYTKQWDGHTTEEKYERVALLQHRQGMEG